MKRPADRVLAVFSNWFRKARPLVGSGKTLLNDPDDFVTLAVIEEQDRLSTIFQSMSGKLLPVRCCAPQASAGHSGLSYAPELTLHQNANQNTDNGVKYYSATVVRRIVTGFSIVLAALLLEGAIVALYLVTSPHVKLGLLALFTALFAASVGLLTNARRSEMFAATAAYAAVLVVFVSGNLSNNTSPT